MNEFTTKHSMFSLKVYPSPKHFTQPLVAMVVTFCKFDTKDDLTSVQINHDSVCRAAPGKASGSAKYANIYRKASKTYLHFLA